MLAALLLAGIVAAPLGSAMLFLPVRQYVRGAGTWPAIRRFTFAVAGTAVLAAAVAGVLELLHVSQHHLIIGITAVIIASLIWLPVTRRWNARAHLCWATASSCSSVTWPSRSNGRSPVTSASPAPAACAAAVGPRGVRRDDGVRLPVGDLRRARNRALGRRVTPRATFDVPEAEPAVRQPARARPQRAARHGDRHAALAAAARLPALRDHPDRRQHRRRGALAAGRGTGAAGTG